MSTNDEPIFPADKNFIVPPVNAALGLHKDLLARVSGGQVLKAETVHSASLATRADSTGRGKNLGESKPGRQNCEGIQITSTSVRLVYLPESVRINLFSRSARVTSN